MAPQFGPHRWSAGDTDPDQTDALRGARVAVSDLTGARFIDCDLSGVRVVDSWLVDVKLSGFVSHLVVNDVDVTAFVASELDRRHPERVQLSRIRTAGDFRALWDTVEGLWSETAVRAGKLSDQALQERVEGEWSFVETLRHLIFITDSWAARTILDRALPYHRLGLPQAAYPAVDATALGIDPGARPPLSEVLPVRADRMALIRGIVDTLTDSDLGRPCTRPPAPGYPEEARAVGECLGVVMEEECEHHRFAVRDLTVLETR